MNEMKIDYLQVCWSQTYGTSLTTIQTDDLIIYGDALIADDFRVDLSSKSQLDDFQGWDSFRVKFVDTKSKQAFLDVCQMFFWPANNKIKVPAKLKSKGSIVQNCMLSLTRKENKDVIINVLHR